MVGPTIPCEHCHESVPVADEQCPHCGAPTTTASKTLGMMVAVAVLLPLLAIVVYFFTPGTADDVGLVGIVVGVLLVGGLVELGLYAVYRDRKRTVEQARREARDGRN